MPRLPLFLLLIGCTDTENPMTFDEQEVITRVVVSLSANGATALEYSWSDPENDGTPEIDEVLLDVMTTYTLGVRFLNEVVNPPEDVTIEVSAESDQHQVFFVVDPTTLAEHAYADTDSNGLPVGLANTLSVSTAGTGTLTVMLRHLPPLDGTAVKVEGLADQPVGSALPGDTDVQVSFPLQVR